MQETPLLAASPGLAFADVMVVCPQNSFLVKHKGGNHALVMRICLGAWEDRETVTARTGQLAVVWDVLQGRARSP